MRMRFVRVPMMATRQHFCGKLLRVCKNYSNVEKECRKSRRKSNHSTVNRISQLYIKMRNNAFNSKALKLNERTLVQIYRK